MRILRLLISAIMPLPILVAMEFVVTDTFHFNKDPEYLRLSEAYEAGYLHIDFLFYLLMAAFYFAVPLLIFSLVLEFAAKNTNSQYLVGLIFGVGFGTFNAWLTTAPSTFATNYHTLEALAHLVGAITVLFFVVMVVTFLKPKIENRPVEMERTGPTDPTNENPYDAPNAG